MEKKGIGLKKFLQTVENQIDIIMLPGVTAPYLRGT
jgi:hypothetical protein